MRRDAIVLGAMLLGVTTIRADDVPNFTGSWMLTGIDVGAGERPVASGYVLNVSQTGTAITVDSPVTATRRTVATFTIDPLTTTTDQKGVATTVRVENQTLIVEVKRPGGCVWNSAPATEQLQQQATGIGLAGCVPRVLRTTYRVSADGATLEMTKVEAAKAGGIGGAGGGTVGFTDDEVRSLAERDGRWVFKRQ